jgi:3-oxoacyl-[acyl-carrier protein] reductase
MKLLITGASSDIGLSIVELFLSNGWDVLGQYRNLNKKLSNLKNSYPEKLKLLQIDFSSKNLEQDLTEYSYEFEGCDSFISCAAELTPNHFSEINIKNLMHVFNINTFPYFLIMKQLLPGFESREWGRILNISSIGVKFGGGKDSFLYSLSKHSSEFIPSDAKKWAKKNIYLNILRAGVTDTKIHKNLPKKNLVDRVNLIPAGRMARAEEVAKMAYFLASTENTYISCQVIAVSGGE